MNMLELNCGTMKVKRIKKKPSKSDWIILTRKNITYFKGNDFIFLGYLIVHCDNSGMT